MVFRWMVSTVDLLAKNVLGFLLFCYSSPYFAKEEHIIHIKFTVFLYSFLILKVDLEISSPLFWISKARIVVNLLQTAEVGPFCTSWADPKMHCLSCQIFYHLSFDEPLETDTMQRDREITCVFLSILSFFIVNIF